MSEIREIVTRAVVAKGKKLLRIKENIAPSNETFSVLGCWVINHEFEACLNQKKVDVNGSFEIDVWYSYDNNTRTDIVRKDVSYSETVKVRELICDNVGEHFDVIARVIQQPTCTNACITEDGIVVEIVFELLVEVIGETKMMVTVFACNNDATDTVDDFENEINEDFIVDK
ncbi:MAG: outer spore coat protein CotE [Bacilli bacterium]|nr:outer spore coat protein CotE [Bacilli bacterium]